MTSQSPLDLIKSEKKITKVHMKISSDSGVKNIDLINQSELDSLTTALKTSTQIIAQQGGAFEIWAEVKIYKGRKMADFFVQFSKYNGWYIDIRNKTFRCDYMFDLVKKYSSK
jgi:hypothetical protein